MVSTLQPPMGMPKAHPAARIGAALEEAVASGGSADLLEEWLQGFELPPLGSGDEPYVSLLRGLAETVERAEVVRVMARWLGEIFNRQPDSTPRGEFPDQLLFNAFYLAAGLAEPDELWEPLLDVYERRALRGDYLGVEHRRALRVALANNQADARLGECWCLMATGGRPGFLLGDVGDGFEALVMMPEPVRGRGYPAKGALAVALAWQLKMLNIVEFNRKLERICTLYPAKQEELRAELVEAAVCMHRTKVCDWLSKSYSKRREDERKWGWLGLAATMRFQTIKVGSAKFVLWENRAARATEGSEAKTKGIEFELHPPPKSEDTQ